MKSGILFALLISTSTAFANPIAVGELDDLPLASENVVVQFHRDEATVEGTYLFDTTKRHGGLLHLIIPIVVRTSDDIEKLGDRFRLQASGNFLGAQLAPSIRPAYPFEEHLAAELPPEWKLVFAVWMLGAVDSTRQSVVSITYTQPLYDGAFYYLPLTKFRATEPDHRDSQIDFGLQMRLRAELGHDVSLDTPNQRAIWGDGFAVVYLKHRNLIAARQVSRPEPVERSAPFIEIISGVRQCAVHHCKLERQTVSAYPGWRHLMTTSPETYEDCPNAFVGAVDPAVARENVIRLTAETCPKCDRVSAQHRAEENKTKPATSDSKQGAQLRNQTATESLITTDGL